MLLRYIIALFVLSISLPAYSLVELGVGTTGATGGRVHPAAVVGIGLDKNWSFTGFSTGANTEVYYQSTYGFAAYKTWKSGPFFFGEVRSGFGIGAFYSKRGLKDTGAGDVEETADDYGIGPAARVNWMFLNPVYIDLQATWGLRHIGGSHLGFNFQDMVVFSIGASL